MNNENSENINKEIAKVCDKYQSERVSGQWYITDYGLNKVASILGGDYKKLTKNQKNLFRRDCINCAHIGRYVKTWWYYINL